MRKARCLVASLLGLAMVGPARGADRPEPDAAKTMAAARQILRTASEVAGSAPQDSGNGPRAWKAQLLRDIALAQAEAGDRQGALSTAAEMPDNPLRATTLEALQGGPSETGPGAAGRSVLRRASPNVMPQEYRRASAQRARVLALVDAGEVQEALRLLQDLPNAAWRANALSAIASNLARAGDVPTALQVAGTIPSQAEKASVLSAIALVQAKAGDRRGALVSFREALRATADIAEEPVRAAAVQAIAAALAEAGAVEAALWLARDQASPLLQSAGLLGAAQGMMKRAAVPGALAMGG